MSVFRPKQFVILVAVLWGVSFCQATIRIVSYNIYFGGIREGFYEILQEIGVTERNDIARPIDILLLQEFTNINTVNSIRNELNARYSGDPAVEYAVGGLIANSGTALLYNAQVVDLLAQVEVVVGGPRSVIRSRFRPVGYTSPQAEFYIYNCHLKAGRNTSDKNTRGTQATNMRADADALGVNVPIIFAGDMNFYGHYQTPSWTEPGWGAFVAEGNAQAFDPISRVGNWHDNPSFINVHTQNPAGSGFVGGGMDDRFDFQLVTDAINNGRGISYIGPNAGYCPATEQSYHAFGNNGTHWLNGKISSGTGASPQVLLYLEAASDHLPVVADYQRPAWMSASVNTDLPAPGVLVKDSTHYASVQVANTAPVTHTLGADRLDYDICTIAGTGAAWGELPVGWMARDVGTPAHSGTAVYLGATESFQLQGAGTIGGTQDSFHFVYEQKSGDFTLIQKIAAMTPATTEGRAGIMIRNTLDANSAYVAVITDPFGQVRWQHRNITGGSTTTAMGQEQDFPVWVKLVRQGNTFSGSQSTDGQNWQSIFSTTIHTNFMQNPVFSGMAAAGGSSLLTATFGQSEDEGGCAVQHTDIAYALAAANVHAVTLDTSETGDWGTIVRAVSESSGVQDGLYEQAVSYRVVDQQDFTGDGMFTVADLNAMLANLGGADSLYDLNGDGGVDQDDMDLLLNEIMGVAYGDLNLSGTVDMDDVKTFLSNWLRDDAAWQHGDTNGDGRVDLQDFKRLARNWTPD